jgi:hypothetical protein
MSIVRAVDDEALHPEYIVRLSFSSIFSESTSPLFGGRSPEL